MPGIPQYHKDLNVINTLVGYYDRTVDASGKLIGTLPKGAILIPGASTANITTAFDGTGPSVLVGTSGTTNAIFAAADITEGTTGIYAASAASLKTGGFHVPCADDTDIIFTVTEPGDGTVGKVYVCLSYYVPFVTAGVPTA